MTTSAEPTLFARLGETAGIATVVVNLYDRVLADPKLAPVFGGADMQSLRAHQVALLSAVSGGPQQYTGRDLSEAHAGLGITGEQFDLVVDHLVAVLVNADVTAEAIGEVGAALMPLKASIVTA